jgi:DNA mismatch repair protein MutS2
VIYPDNIEKKLGFDKIRKDLEGFCLSSLGVEKIIGLKFSTHFEFINNQLCKLNEFKNVCQYEDDYPVDHYYDLTGVLKNLRVEGSFIETEDLYALRKSLFAISQVHAFFGTEGNTLKYPVLHAFTRDIPVFPHVIKNIDRILSPDGIIKDSASPAQNWLPKKRM